MIWSHLPRHFSVSRYPLCSVGTFCSLHPPTDRITQGSGARKRGDIKAEPWENVMFRGHEYEKGPAKDTQRKEEIILSMKPSKENISGRKEWSSFRCCCEDNKIRTEGGEMPEGGPSLSLWEVPSPTRIKDGSSFYPQMGVGHKGAGGREWKGAQRNFQDDRYIHCCDCSGGFMSLYSCENISCCIL